MDKSTLRKHKQYKDKGVKYSCDECDHKASTKGSLQRHKGSCWQSKHIGVECSCDECEYQAGFQSAFDTRKQSKHEGVKSFCDECEYQA